jgi:hypothetical protein
MMNKMLYFYIHVLHLIQHVDVTFACFCVQRRLCAMLLVYDSVQISLVFATGTKKCHAHIQALG